MRFAALTASSRSIDPLRRLDYIAVLAHRQHRPLLVVPLQEPVPDEQPEIWTE
jgi:hypothetical protein